MGSLPVFSGEVNDHGIRDIEYRADHWVDNFPLIWSNDRQLDALEMNLFLEHRYKGLYRAPKRAARSNPLGGISLKTLQSIANSLCIFLRWISEVICFNQTGHFNKEYNPIIEVLNDETKEQKLYSRV